LKYNKINCFFKWNFIFEETLKVNQVKFLRLKEELKGKEMLEWERKRERERERERERNNLF